MGDATGARSVSADVPVTIVRNSLLGGALGGLTGAFVGTLRAPAVEPAIASLQMAKNWFAFLFGFFGPLENVAPSFLSGAAMGGVAAGIMRRPIFPGMLTFAGLCTGAQLTVNGIRAGAQYVVRKCGWEEPAPVVAAPASGTGAEVKQPVDASPEVPQKSSIWSRACTWLAENSPIQPLSDSEYKERLQRRGAELDAELVLLERELAHYRQALQDSKS